MNVGLLAHLGHLEGKPDNPILKGDENDHPSPGTMASFQQQITRIQASFHGHQQKNLHLDVPGS